MTTGPTMLRIVKARVTKGAKARRKFASQGGLLPATLRIISSSRLSSCAPKRHEKKTRSEKKNANGGEKERRKSGVDRPGKRKRQRRHNKHQRGRPWHRDVGINVETSARRSPATQSLPLSIGLREACGRGRRERKIRAPETDAHRTSRKRHQQCVETHRLRLRRCRRWTRQRQQAQPRARARRKKLSLGHCRIGLIRTSGRREMPIPVWVMTRVHHPTQRLNPFRQQERNTAKLEGGLPFRSTTAAS